MNQSVKRAARAAADDPRVREAAEGELRRRGGPLTEELLDAADDAGTGDGGSDRSGRKGRSKGRGEDGLDPKDFPAAREQGGGTETLMTQQVIGMDEAHEVLNRSEQTREKGRLVHSICPVALPRGRSFRSMLPVLLLLVVGAIGSSGAGASAGAGAGGAGATGASPLLHPVFGIHYWVLSLIAVGFVWWRQGMVMVPDGCQALITRFGKLEEVVGPGRVILLNPWKRVSYIVNTTREYPFNAPVREAPTKGGVKASIDLFIQFRINDPVEFVYTLGAVRGFEEKLSNAVSETIRSLIYEQQAAEIYDMVGEDTGRLLEQLNEQFRPAVELTNANITHAEPADRGYRMDLASPEMVRVAKDAYTHEYQLTLRKEQDEGDLTRELASQREELSAIMAEIAQYQAQMDTAVERETNRAEATARQRYVQAESEARANAALLEAQALDIRAMTAAEAPEILQYRYQQQVLDTLEGVADHLPRLLRIGGTDGQGHGLGLDYLALARELIGEHGGDLFSETDMAAVRERLDDVAERIRTRETEIAALLEADRPTVPAPATGAAEPAADAGEPTVTAAEEAAE